MANYKQLFVDYMNSHNIIYTEVNDHVVRVSYTGDNMKSIPVFVFFDENGDNIVQLFCMEIANFKDNMAAGLVACNELNTKYRWVKFYLGSDNEIICTIDAYLDQYSCGEECRNLVGRVVSIVDEAYPTFMRALWSK